MDLLWTCVINMFSNLTQSVGVHLNDVIINLGSLLWLNGLLSPVPAVYASPVILHQFSPPTYVARALLVANGTHLNGAPLLAIVLVWLQIVFFPFPRLFPLVCYLRTSQAFLCPQEMWNTWLSRPSSIVSPIGQIHHDLFLIHPLAK